MTTMRTETDPDAPWADVIPCEFGVEQPEIGLIVCMEKIPRTTTKVTPTARNDDVRRDERAARKIFIPEKLYSDRLS